MLAEDLIPLPQSSDEEECELSDIDSIHNSDEEDRASDSDSAPECFSFSATQEDNRLAQKLAVKAIKVQKDELKRKRKEIFLQNLKQREEKRQKIESKKLPDHILKNLDDEFKEKELEDKTQELAGQVEQEVKEVESEEAKVVTTAGNITFKCKVLSPETQKSRHVPPQVAHFKDRLLYGNRIKREKSNRTAILEREKQCIKR